MRDHASDFNFVLSTAPAVITATDTATGIDTRGYDSVTFAINTGAIVGAGNFTSKVQDSDVLGSGYVDVAANYLTGSTLPAVLAAASAYKVGYIGPKRYARLVTTLNSGTSIGFSAQMLRSRPSRFPAA